MNHYISKHADGEDCNICGDPARHKVGEEILNDDPIPNRHNLTAYVCCMCFAMIFGEAAPCHGDPE